MKENQIRKPDWLRVPRHTGDRYHKIRRILSKQSLHTVCEEANCPNKSECWNAGTATFMLLGDTCTRGCAFCAVTRGNPQGQCDLSEPQRVADTVGEVGLEYAVLTSVTRDDLGDGGATLFAETICRIKELESSPLVEVLIPDYSGNQLDVVLDAGPAVVAHNIEVVERLFCHYRHQRFSYQRSLDVLRQISSKSNEITAKSSIMLGLGETAIEIEQTMKDLLAVGVKILVLGQYLAPTRRHVSVQEYISPKIFNYWAKRGKELGFDFVAAGPLVRTSYRAAEAYRQ